MTEKATITLPKQFLIAREIPQQYSDWSFRKIEDWFVIAANKVPLISIVNQQSTVVGILVGWAINEGALLKNGNILEIPDDQNDRLNYLNQLCGRYLIIMSLAGKVEITLDAGGLLPVVYHQTQKMVASSPAMFTGLFPLDANQELIDAFDIPNRKGWYPFGLTPFDNIRRILPNMVFDMKEWHSRRCWPTNGVRLITNDKTEKTMREIAEMVVVNVGGIVRGKTGYVHLTAGYDSRMVLAACKPFIEDCVFETVRQNDKGTELDCFMAKRMSRKLGLNHEFLDFIPPSKAQISNWLFRTSNCVFDAVTLLSATIEKNDREYHSITGTCGEVGRGYYWAPKGASDNFITAEILIGRLKVPSTPQVVEAAEEWLAGIPERRSTLVWDLAYIEQRLGGWAGPSVYGHDVDYPSLSPFNSPKIYQLMLSLPEEYRQSHQFVKDYMAYLWPEVLDFPFNRAAGLSRLKFLKAEIREMLPPRLRKFLKKLLR